MENMMNGSELAGLRKIEIEPLDQAMLGFKALSRCRFPLDLATIRTRVEEWLLEGVSPSFGSTLTVVSGLACATLTLL